MQTSHEHTSDQVEELIDMFQRNLSFDLVVQVLHILVGSIYKVLIVDRCTRSRHMSIADIKCGEMQGLALLPHS